MPQPHLVPVPLARGRRGAVVAPHHLASAAGLEVLAAGGHAVDAAIATNAALAVVMPNACGIGGDAFWLIWEHAAGSLRGLNGSGRSAAGADAAGLRALGLTTLPLRGPLSITVPGAVRSWGDAHAEFGRLPREQVLAPAIELARGGYPAWDGFIAAVESMGAVGDASFQRLFRPHGRPWQPGEVVRRPEIATTLERLARDGFDAFYDGELADRQASALEAAGSAIRAADFREHRSTWTEPLATTYRGVRVATHRPNSSGIVGLELLNMLERFDPPAAGTEPDARWLHLGIEAAKLAMADRDRHLTDEAFREIPVQRLLDKAYAAELGGQIDERRASPAPPARSPRGGGTIYLATVDAEGNAVSLIESNYGGFGSGVADAASGVHYQNRGSYFSLDPEHPNVLEPSKRTLHTLLPAMLFRDGSAEPWVVLGSMGGDAQPQILAQVVSGLVDLGRDVRAAVQAARWFVEPAEHFARPVEVRAEPRFPAGVLDELRRLGHPVDEVASFDARLGHCHAIELVAGGPAATDGSLAAATDPRSAGLPAVR
jgi:gamma-glutamyltranspeptidase/glutathione hydrolase